MNYEDMTFEVIMQRMLDRVPNNMDKREGSIIYDALAPAAVELTLLYIEFGIIQNEGYADTASRDYLIKRVAERGITPYAATQAILEATFTPETLEVPIGSRFNYDNLNYEVIEKISDGKYQIRCETYGIEGNNASGTLLPIDYIDGLETAQITQILIPGEDEEDTESLRQRYFDSFDTTAFGGNKKDYIQKTNAIEGVGATKVTPVWNGGGTVKLTIIDSSFNKASSVLIEKVQEEIDPSNDANGIGIAPIGHIVTVDTVEEITVNITSNITFEEHYTFERLKDQITKLIEEYLLDLRHQWADNDELVVRISQIENKILSVEGVVDITDTQINGVASNLVLTEYQIPKLGGITT